MPYSMAIPGQVSELELRAIELVAGLAPSGGIVVEVGSLFGRSSWAWAKSVDPTVKIVCIDPWAKNAGVRPMEKRLGIKYGIAEFEKNTRDCENIEALEGYSPRDFLNWDQKIDIYYDDSVHTDPTFSANLDFWSSHLRPRGVICGDDFRPRFPDIQNGARRYAEKLGRELIVVDFFWCLLPAQDEDDAVVRVREGLRLLAQEKAEIEANMPPQIAANILGETQGRLGDDTVRLILRMTNLRHATWPSEDAADSKIYLDAFLVDSAGRERMRKDSMPLPVSVLSFDIPCDVEIDLPIVGIPVGDYEIQLGLRAAPVSGAPRQIQPLYKGPFEITRPSSFGAEFERAPALNSADYYLRYCETKVARETMGISSAGHQNYLLRKSSGDVQVRSMLLIYELALLYALAKNHYKGSGKIVDAGPLLGASTNALCKGLSDNDNVTLDGNIVYSFDLFSIRGYERFLGASVPKTATGSLLGVFSSINSEYADIIVPHQGDFLETTWDGTPIEILFVDLAKSWDLHDHVIKTFFPSLIPGHSVIFHQDYIHFNEYWIHIFMEYYADRFTFLGMLRGATAYFRLEKTFTPEEAARSLRTLPYAEKRELMESAMRKAPPPVREVMKTSLAKCALDHEQIDEARSLLDSVVISPLTEDPILEVSGIARSNHDAVAAMLKSAS